VVVGYQEKRAKAEEERRAREASEQRSRPEISEYARSLPRLTDDERIQRLSRSSIDKHLLQTFVRSQ
jgi:hypothetical protein